MNISTQKLPTYAKLAQIIIGLIGFFYILYIGRDILVPITFAVIFGILLNPVVNFLERKGCNRIVAIALALFGISIIGAGVALFIISQLSQFSETLPQLKEKFTVLENDFVGWISETFNIKQSKINSSIADSKENLESSQIFKVFGSIFL